MDYETSPAMQFEGADDVVPDEHQIEGNAPDGSTGSEGSEGFVKVEDVIDEPEEKKVEETPLIEIAPAQSIKSEKSELSIGSDVAMLKCLDPRDSEFSTQKGLQDYYEQLPTETAPFDSDDLNSDVAKQATGCGDTKLIDMDLTMQSAVSDALVSSSNLPEEVDLIDHDGVIQTVNFVENSGPDSPTTPMDVSESPPIQTPPEDDFPIVLDDDSPILQEDNFPVVKDEPASEEQKNETPAEVEVNEPEIKQESPPSGESNRVEEVEQSPAEHPALTILKLCNIASFFKWPRGGGAEYENRCSEDPVVDLLYWRDIKVSAVVFGLTLLVLVSLRCLSIISVASYLGLSLLTVTITFRLAKLVMQTVNGTQQPNPFQGLLDTDVTLSNEQVQKYVETLVSHLNCTLVCTRDLVLVKNTVSSLKFGTMLWLATYIGCCFNGLTLLTIGFVLAFALPPLYEKYQAPIDKHYDIVKGKICQVTSLIRSKIPGAKPKSE